MFERGYILSRAMKHRSDVLITNYKILPNKVNRDISNQKTKYCEVRSALPSLKPSPQFKMGKTPAVARGRISAACWLWE